MKTSRFARPSALRVAATSRGEKGILVAVWVALWVALSGFAHAQTGGGFDLSWSTIDSAGGTRTGGGFTLAGTIGQPDAGVMSGGGSFTIDGGFWGITALQTPGAPLLSVARQDSGVRIFWPLPATGFVLDHSPTVTDAWSQVSFPYVTNATDISTTVSAPAMNRFYRLRKP